jgi:hypothetical protein
MARSASSFVISMPVSTPIEASMKARSSVEALPLAPGACGQPPMPASEASKRCTPEFEGRVAIGEREAARVVEVAAPELVAGNLQRLLEQTADAAGFA